MPVLSRLAAAEDLREALSGARACFSTSSAARGAGERVTGEGEHAERRGGAGRWPARKQRAAVLSVELNCGAECA